MTWGSGFADLGTEASDVRDYDCSAEVTEDIRICEPESFCRAPMMRTRACVVRWFLTVEGCMSVYFKGRTMEG